MADDITRRAVEDAIAKLRNLDVMGTTLGSATKMTKQSLEDLRRELESGGITTDRRHVLTTFIGVLQSTNQQLSDVERAVTKALNKAWPA